MKKIGFIGTGNMAYAMIGGLVNSEKYHKDHILASGRNYARNNRVESDLGIKVFKDNIKIAEECDLIFLAVKPYAYPEVIKEIKEHLKDEVVIVSIAAGIKSIDLKKMLGEDTKFIRTMPNTPSLVSEGMSAICEDKSISQNDMDYIVDIFNCFGEVEIIEEKLMHGFIGVSGSSPAYVYMFIEALADGAVLHGIPREKAYKMAAQTVLGSARMVLETGLHPGELKDAVCSPAGTTIEAVAELEKQGFRNAIISAVNKCSDKSKKMEK